MSTGGTLTIRGGTLAVPRPIPCHGPSIELVEGDLSIVDGRIAAIGSVPDDRGEVIDARGLLVMPGAIDPQVHFREPGATHKEDLESGARACAAGGITAFCEMPNTRPPTTTPEAFEDKLARAAAGSVVHYGFFVGATAENVAVQNAIPNACGIKVFMGSSTGTLLVDEQAALEAIFSTGRRLVAVHAEDETRLVQRQQAFRGTGRVADHARIRDAETALLATRRAVALSDRFDRRLHVLHMTTAEEAAFLRAHGKGAGRISAEVCPQHLLLDGDEAYARLGTLAQMNPPIRSPRHQRALWAALLDGTIDCIATDHAPHTLAEKAQPYGTAPSGMPGVETSLPLMLDAAHRGLCSVAQVVHWMSAAPARLYQMEGKGQLAVGFDGDVTLVDPKLCAEVGARGFQSKCGWSPFQGQRLTGWPRMTIVLGRPVCRDGVIDGTVRGRPIQFARPS